MNGYDKLLIFLSELGRGDWHDFTSAVDTVHLPQVPDASKYFLAEALTSLGHIEFIEAGPPNSDAQWAAAPPAMVTVPVPRNQWVGVLAGSRTQERLMEVLEAGFSVREQELGPSVVETDARANSDLLMLAQQLDLAFAPNLAEELASVLPSVTEAVSAATERAAPIGWNIFRFDESRLAWIPVGADEAPGLYRYVHFTTEYRLKIDGCCLRVERRIGIYEWLRRCNRAVVQYDSSAWELRVPAVADLPAVASRAAVMCTGRLPVTELMHGRLVRRYGGVSARIAQLIEASLS